MFLAENKLELTFRLASYFVVFVSLITLATAGSIGLISFLFFTSIIIIGWNLENSNFQISEKMGVFFIILIIPLFYIDWKLNISGLSSLDALTSSNLSKIVLSLISIKLLQYKKNRDWVFIYIISFFEILLAASVGISPLFLVCLLVYFLISITVIILFEIRQSSNSILEIREKKSILLLDDTFKKSLFCKLSVTSLIVISSITLIAIPIFFAFPRLGGAGLGSNGSGLSGFTGFSDSVKLGEIGKLQQSEEVVMRVRLKTEGNDIEQLRWRGVALDNFDGQIWRKTKFSNTESIIKTEGNYFILDKANDVNKLITQTIYLEPIDSPVLFTLYRPIAIQGNFDFLNRDVEGSLTNIRQNSSRISYKVFSDAKLPDINELSSDNFINPSLVNRYLQLPKGLDPRIPELVKKIISESKNTNRYDQVKVIESYLQNNFGYTLDLKAGGDDPLSDFLFNVKEGHCEYFASALAIMLRIQGIPTRVVNGFQSGEYNETAGVYVVKQKNAHSWVEVYFPKTKSWVPFDATPSAGQNVVSESGGFFAKINNIAEALEAFWIQYVVSFDNNEQKILFMSLRNYLTSLQEKLIFLLESVKESLYEWWKRVKGEDGFKVSLLAIVTGIIYLTGSVIGLILLIWSWKKLKKYQLWTKLRQRFQRKRETSVVEFYQRMQKVLAKQGQIRQPQQTPLEFAFALNMPQAINITEKYNEVRFGKKKLSAEEATEIDNWLKGLEEINK